MRPRKIYPALKSHMIKKQIMVLTGMRRTGKTTIVKKLLEEIPSKNKLYLDLERFDNRELFLEKNYENIIEALKQRGIDTKIRFYIALDELQLAPESPSVLKYLYDNYNVKFIVTGSSSYYLKNLFTESLAGRKKIFELYPLDFEEWLTFKEVLHKKNNFLTLNFQPAEYQRLKSYYEEYIEYGGFPEVVLAKKIEDKKDILNDIVSSYINIDIKILADFRRQDELFAIIKMLAGRVGTKLDYSKIARLAGIARQTVHAYIDFFEKTYLIARVSVTAKNADREIVKAKKIYFSDNGILNCLGDIGSGAKFENALFTQLRSKGEVKYFSLKTGHEIDFIFNDSYGLEGKESPTSFDKKNLKNLEKKARIKKTRLIGRYPVANFTDYIWGGQII